MEEKKQHLSLKRAVPIPIRFMELQVVFKAPVMTGWEYEGPAWKTYCFLDVHLDGTRLYTWSLPLMDGKVKNWERFMSVRVGCSSWPRMSLDLEVHRRDYLEDDDGRRVVFRAGEPHDSDHTAVLGAARLQLLDALVLADDSDDDDEVAEKKKRRLDRELNLVEGTRIFNEKVTLQGWRAPAEGDVDGEPTNVACGVVTVFMCLTEGVEDSDD